MNLGNLPTAPKICAAIALNLTDLFIIIRLNVLQKDQVICSVLLCFLDDRGKGWEYLGNSIQPATLYASARSQTA